MYYYISEIINDAESKGKLISDLMIEQEITDTHKTYEVIWKRMDDSLTTMENASKEAVKGKGVFSPTGLTGGDAVKLKVYREENYNRTLAGDKTLMGVQNAMGINEVNAAMGVICATPTAGASGTLPGVLFTIRDTLKLTREEQVRFLFTASLFGMVVANNAMIAGAAGGCQAEVGTSSAISAAAAVEAAGGTPKQCSEAFSIALSNILGLVCDPIAGLVEIPCVKRNAIGCGNALIAADLALANIENIVPADEVIEAMRQIGIVLPPELRETGLGGMAATPTGCEIKERIFGKGQTLNYDGVTSKENIKEINEM